MFAILQAGDTTNIIHDMSASRRIIIMDDFHYNPPSTPSTANQFSINLTLEKYFSQKKQETFGGY